MNKVLLLLLLAAVVVTAAAVAVAVAVVVVVIVIFARKICITVIMLCYSNCTLLLYFRIFF